MERNNLPGKAPSAEAIQSNLFSVFPLTSHDSLFIFQPAAMKNEVCYNTLPSPLPQSNTYKPLMLKQKVLMVFTLESQCIHAHEETSC